MRKTPTRRKMIILEISSLRRGLNGKKLLIGGIDVKGKKPEN